MNKYELVKLNTARNALKYVINAFQIKELYLPYYLCPALRITAVKENCTLKFYHINKNFEPICDFPSNAYILYPDYFGICSEIVEGLANKYNNLIVDNAHAFYSGPKGIAAFCSLRKFFPMLQDSAFLYTTKTLNTKLPKDDYKYVYEKLSFENLCKNESRLDKETLKTMSDCTQKYFSKLDLNKEKQKFIDNFKQNHKKYGAGNNLKFTVENIVPYKYPYLAGSEEEADKLVNQLEKKGITTFRYWHNLPPNFPEKIFYTRLVLI